MQSAAATSRAHSPRSLQARGSFQEGDTWELVLLLLTSNVTLAPFSGAEIGSCESSHAIPSLESPRSRFNLALARITGNARRLPGAKLAAVG